MHNPDRLKEVNEKFCPQIKTIVAPPPGISYEDRRHIMEFKGFDWNASRSYEQRRIDAVMFARCTGFKETGMSVNEVALLFDCLEKKGPCSIIELGRNYGCSTRLFIQHLAQHSGKLESWDLSHWPGFVEGMADAGYEFFNVDKERSAAGFVEYQNLGLVTQEGRDVVMEPLRTHIRIADSIKSPIAPKTEVDFLLIDTEHGLDDALGEYMRWRRYLRGGSMIAFHDSTLPGVARAIEIIKEVESYGNNERLAFEYVNEAEDGFGVHILQWKG